MHARLCPSFVYSLLVPGTVGMSPAAVAFGPFFRLAVIAPVPVAASIGGCL
jgi:hypothetical protein